MSPRLAVAAVIAHDCGLDQAATFDTGVRLEAKHQVTRMVPVRRFVSVRWLVCGGFVVTRDHRSNEAPQFLLVHGVTSTVSMIPTIAASTGASVRPRICPAARPSMTISTRS